VRRGASFEAWLRKRGYPADVAEQWAAHAVWATGYATGRWGKVLFDVTPSELADLATSGWVDWEQVGPAVTAWFDWLRGDEERVERRRVAAAAPAGPAGPRTTPRTHPSAAPYLRVVEGGS
jgi:hypothetical protein